MSVCDGRFKVLFKGPGALYCFWHALNVREERVKRVKRAVLAMINSELVCKSREQQSGPCETECETRVKRLRGLFFFPFLARIPLIYH